MVPGPLKGLRAEIHRGGSVPFYGEETGTWYSDMTKKGRVYGCLARAMTVAEKLEKRLSSLRVEFESGQKMLADLEEAASSGALGEGDYRRRRRILEGRLRELEDER